MINKLFAKMFRVSAKLPFLYNHSLNILRILLDLTDVNFLNPGQAYLVRFDQYRL